MRDRRLPASKPSNFVPDVAGQPGLDYRNRFGWLHSAWPQFTVSPPERHFQQFLREFMNRFVVEDSDVVVPNVLNELNKKYTNRVLHDVGLCICAFDVVEGMGTGFFGTQSSFRTTVFRPFPTEINYGESQILGRRRHTAIRRHVDSARSPPQPCPFDPQERAYSWFPSSEATSTHELRGSPEAERLYIDQGENVRASGERDEFRDDDPGPPKATEGVLISGQVQARRLPCTVTGLGAIAWWKTSEATMDEG